MAKASITQGDPAVPAKPADSIATEPLAGASELESFMAGHLEAVFDSATPKQEKTQPATTPKAGPEEAAAPAPTDGGHDESTTTKDDDEDGDAGVLSLADIIEITERDEDAGDDGDDDDGDDEESDAPPKDKAETPEWVQKRLSKMSEQKREWKGKAEQAVAEISRLKEELDAARAGKFTLPPTKDDPLADVQDEQTLAARLEAANAALEWLDEHPDGGAFEVGGNEVELSSAEVAKRRRYFEGLVNKHADARKAWLADRQAATTEARKHYAAMYQDGTRLAGVRAGMLSTIPGLAGRADADVFVGDAYVGALVRSGVLRVFRNDAKAKPKAAAPQPSTPAKPAAHSPATTGPATQRERAAGALLQKAALTGDRNALTGALEAMLG